jgi:hypothetical protein
MIAVVTIAGVLGILYLAISGAIDNNEAPPPAPDAPSTPPEYGPSNSTDNPSTFIIGTMDIVASDQDTWPGGDAVWDVARAIAVAEGYGKTGAAPTLMHNPGDISDGGGTFGYEYHGGSNVTKFPDDITGWTWLYNKLNNIRNGKSTKYSNNMTWNELAHTWAGNWQNWLNNVTRELHVAPTDRVGDYWGA